MSKNAIWHGLSDKVGEGHIQVEFCLQNGHLCCSVEDNGIGREAAKKQRKKQSHESKALAITKKRLELLEREEGQSAFYEILDLYDESGRAVGVRVELQLPVIR